MKYERPEITLINRATTVMKGMTKNGQPYDNPAAQTLTAPAYEADE